MKKLLFLIILATILGGCLKVSQRPTAYHNRQPTFTSGRPGI